MSRPDSTEFRVVLMGLSGGLHVAEVTSRFVSTEAFVEAVKSFGFKLDNQVCRMAGSLLHRTDLTKTQESPSTHFTLFRFVKTATVPQGPVKGRDGWQARLKEGETILRPCVYKKR